MLAIAPTIVLPGLEVCVSFHNRSGVRSVGPDVVSRRLLLVHPGESLTQPEHRIQGFPRGSRLTLQLSDDRGQALTRECPIGWEAAGQRQDIDLEFPIPVIAAAWIEARGWSESHRPILRESGEMCFAHGVTVCVSAGRTPCGSGRAGAAAHGFYVVGPGMSLYSRPTTFEGGLPDTPWVSIKFLDERGRRMGLEQLVGRLAAV